MTHCTACRAARPQSARLLSLFDSLGPIMSGPSSHTAGMARIGRMGRSLVGGTPERITLHFFGALSHTYKGHASDSAVVAGLIGEREDSQCGTRALAAGGASKWKSARIDSGRNPNTVSMELVRGGGRMRWRAFPSAAARSR
ncbi:MAG: serine dehydratase beta chain [Bilophila wadsworthia]